MILFRGQPLPARYSAARGRRGLTPILPDAYISPATGRIDRKSTRLNSSHSKQSRMPSSA